LEQSEVQTLVEELEIRVERLRALYDQYFMGIEKLEPSVPRKDVERRLYVLRRTQIRNTGMRFRFQNALLRFNTYQTYWMRICRQIEEGTYKRDVRRANARFATKQRTPEERAAEPEVHDTEPPGPPSFELDEGEDVDLNFDEDGSMSESDWIEELQMRAILRPTGLPKDLTAGRGGAEQPASGSAPKNPPPASRPEVGAGQPKTAPSSSRRSSRPTAPAPAKSQPQVGGVRYVQGGKAQAPSEEPVPRAAARALPPLTAPPATGARAPAGASGPPKKKSRPSMAKVEAAKPARHPTARPPSKSPKEPKEGLSEERVRQIYTQYVDTKRSLQESTASLTYEGLSRSLHDSSDKLRQKHTGKSVDFEVTVKDGKTVLRPIVK
jgi:hypothetical protein